MDAFSPNPATIPAARGFYPQGQTRPGTGSLCPVAIGAAVEVTKLPKRAGKDLMVDIWRRAAGIPVGTCSFQSSSLGATGLLFWAGLSGLATHGLPSSFSPEIGVIPFPIF